MGFTDTDLRNEIRGHLLERVGEGDEIIPDWVAIQVIQRHLPDFKREPDFVANAVWGHVRKAVGVEARNFKQGADENIGGQETLEGFELLQEYYECKRVEGNNVVVARIHREKMSLKEVREQADSLIETGTSWVNHGNQLHRWADMREAEGHFDDDD